VSEFPRLQLMKENTITLRFCFHDLIGIEVVTDHPLVESFFAAEYQHHRVERFPDGIPYVRLKFGLCAFPLVVVPVGYQRHVHKLLARWAYRMSISDNHIEIDVIGNCWAIPMVHHMLVHPSLRYLSSKHDVILLHSGSVAFSGKSLIFTGKGGTGKTTTTSLILAYGSPAWAGHSDDYTFLVPGPGSWSYQTRSHLYWDLLNWVPELAGRLSYFERVRLAVLGLFRSATQGGLLWPVRLPFDRLWPGKVVQIQASPVAVILLERSPIQSPQLKRLSSDKMPVDDLIEMNFWEARHFIALVKQAGVFSDPDTWIGQWRLDEYNLLSKRLEEISVYSLELPQEAGRTLEFKQKLIAIMDKLVS
jgi:hypothetical protein